MYMTSSTREVCALQSSSSCCLLPSLSLSLRLAFGRLGLSFLLSSTFPLSLSLRLAFGRLGLSFLLPSAFPLFLSLRQTLGYLGLNFLMTSPTM